MDESNLQNLDKMDLLDMRPEFTEQVFKFRKNMESTIKVKTIKGKEIRGEILAELVKVYVAAINDTTGDDLPIIESGWKYVCKKECEEIIDELEEQLQ